MKYFTIYTYRFTDLSSKKKKKKKKIHSLPVLKSLPSTFGTERLMRDDRTWRILVPDRIIIAYIHIPCTYLVVVSSLLFRYDAPRIRSSFESALIHSRCKLGCRAHNGERSRYCTSFEMRFRKLEIINRWKGLRGVRDFAPVGPQRYY